jgi:hypothetical protein
MNPKARKAKQYGVERLVREVGGRERARLKMERKQLEKRLRLFRELENRTRSFTPLSRDAIASLLALNQLAVSTCNVALLTTTQLDSLYLRLMRVGFSGEQIREEITVQKSQLLKENPGLASVLHRTPSAERKD